MVRCVGLSRPHVPRAYANWLMSAIDRERTLEAVQSISFPCYHQGAPELIQVPKVFSNAIRHWENTGERTSASIMSAFEPKNQDRRAPMTLRLARRGTACI